MREMKMNRVSKMMMTITKIYINVWDELDKEEDAASRIRRRSRSATG